MIKQTRRVDHAPSNIFDRLAAIALVRFQEFGDCPAFAVGPEPAVEVRYISLPGCRRPINPPSDGDPPGGVRQLFVQLSAFNFVQHLCHARSFGPSHSHCRRPRRRPNSFRKYVRLAVP